MAARIHDDGIGHASRSASISSATLTLATDPMARIDVPFLMTQRHGRILAVEDHDGLLRLTVETGDWPVAPTD